MDNNQFNRDIPPNRDTRDLRDRRDSRKTIWMCVAAVTVSAAVAFLALNLASVNRLGVKVQATEVLNGEREGTIVPMEASQAAPAQVPGEGAVTAPSDVEPAEGDAFTTPSTHSDAATDHDASAAVPAGNVVAPAATSTSLTSYSSEEECKSASSAPCHFVTCDSVPEGKQPEEVCGADFKQGWQPVAPSTDKTSVPEQVAPPLTGQGNAPADQTPPLTGQ